MSYLVAFCESNRELVFRDAVNRYGIDAYAPISRIQCRLKRHSRRKRIIERAVFAHYVFVKISDQIYDIVRVMPGFLSWLWVADEIAYVNEDMIMALKNRETNGEFDRISKDPSQIFTKGTRVKILTGVFANMEGVVVRPPKRQGILHVEICGKIIETPIVIVAMMV